MTAAATLATFADFRIVKTRKLAQFVFEVPIERADEALTALGGLPRSDGERWCGIALVSAGPDEAPPPSRASEPVAQDRDKPRRRFSELPRSQQAGMLCNDPRFQKWMGAPTAEETALRVRMHCDVASRAELDDYQHFPQSASKWDDLAVAFHAENSLMAEMR